MDEPLQFPLVWPPSEHDYKLAKEAFVSNLPGLFYFEFSYSVLLSAVFQTGVSMVSHFTFPRASCVVVRRHLNMGGSSCHQCAPSM